jgi:hypothetical protein
MSISKGSRKVVVGLVTAAFAIASAGAIAQDRYDDRYESSRQGRYDDRYDPRDDGRYDDRGYDYAKVVDVQPLMTRVRVSTPSR